MKLIKILLGVFLVNLLTNPLSAQGIEEIQVNSNSSAPLGFSAPNQLSLPLKEGDHVLNINLLLNLGLQKNVSIEKKMAICEFFLTTIPMVALFYLSVASSESLWKLILQGGEASGLSLSLISSSAIGVVYWIMKEFYHRDTTTVQLATTATQK